MLDLAHQVGAYIGGLGEDTAAHTHEQGNQRAAEAEAQQRVGRGLGEEHEDERAAQQAQAVGQHAGDGPGAVSDAQRVLEAGAGRVRHAHVALHGHTHAQLTYQQREARAHDKGHGTAEADDQLDCILAVTRKHLQREFRRRNNVDTQKHCHSQNSNEGQDRPQLPG